MKQAYVEMRKLSLDRIYLLIVAIYGIFKIIAFNDMTSIVTDEIQYKEMILGLAKPHLFNPLYIRIYSFVGFFGEYWYLVARIINLSFVLLGSVAIIKLSKQLEFKFLDKAIVYVSSLLTGSMTYFLNVMPESLYIALFYWMMYIFLSVRDSSLRFVLISILNGCLSLIKPHALILFPALLLALSFNDLRRRKFSAVLLKLIIYFGIFALIRWGLGYMFEGNVALGFFGGNYETMGQRSIPFNIHDIVYVINRHLTAWFIMIPILIPIVLKFIFSPQVSSKYTEFIVAIFGIVACSIVAFSLFTVIVHTDFNNQLYRVHLRYYSFLIPLLIASILYMSYQISEVRGSKAYLFSLLLSGFYLAYSIGSSFAPEKHILSGNWIESPTIAYLNRQPSLMIALSIALFSVILFYFYSNGLKYALFIGLALFAVSEYLQHGFSMNAMSRSKQSLTIFRTISRITDNQPFDIQLYNDPLQGTRLDMIECIKIFMIQDKRKFRNVCVKGQPAINSRFIVYLNHSNLVEQPIGYSLYETFLDGDQTISIYQKNV